MSTATPENRPSNRSIASSKTPSTMYAALDPAVRERIDRITPIGRDSSGNFLFKPEDQAFVNSLVAAGATIDRNGKFTNIPEGIRLDPFLDDDQDDPRLICGCMKPRTFVFFVVVVAILVILVAIVGVVIATTSSPNGNGPPAGKERFISPTESTSSPSFSTPFPSLQPSGAFEKETTNVTTTTQGAPTDGTVEPSSVPAPPSLPGILTPPPTLGNFLTQPPSIGIGSSPPMEQRISAPSVAPTNDNNCNSLCADGSLVPFPERIIGNDSKTGRNLTCGEVDLRFDDYVDNGCLIMQARGAAYCGCAGPPPENSICWICHDNMPLAPEKSEFVAFLGSDNSSITCGDIAVDLAVDDENPEGLCFDGQVWGSLLCGCNSPPSEAKCWICPDGSVPSAISNMDSGLMESCVEAAEAIAKIDDADLCQVQVDIWAPICGCGVETIVVPSASPTVSAKQTLLLDITPSPSIKNVDTNCTSLCADGSPVPFPDRIIGTSEQTGTNLTCGEVDLRFDAFVENGCAFLQTRGAARCGCPPPENVPCWICHDNMPVEFENFDTVVFHSSIDGSPITCGDITVIIAEDTDELCFDGQVKGSLTCGCTSPHPAAKCWICPDGSSPSIFSSTDQELRETCRRAAEVIALIDNEDACKTQVDVWAPLCGCANSTAPPAAGKTTSPTPSPSLSPTAVAPTRTIATSCDTVCADGSRVPFPDNIAIDGLAGDRNMTCGELEENIVGANFNATDCLTIQTWGAILCGCPGPPPEDTVCWVCHDDATNPVHENMDTVIAVVESDGFALTCGNMAMNLATDVTNEDGLCLTAQVFGSLFCGCPSPHPEATCWICPDGGYPSIPIDSVDRTACVEAALFIAGIDDPALCQQEVEFWAPTCGCTTGPTPASTNSPTSAATSGAPTAKTPPTATQTLSKQPTSARSSSSCGTLCSDGSSVPFPTNTAVPAPSADDPKTTCGRLEANFDGFVRRFAKENDQDMEMACFHFQVVGSLRCGCVSPHPLATCWFECPEGGTLAQDKLDDVIGFDTSGNSFTCMDIALTAAVSKEQDDNGDAVCASILEVWSDPCCEAPV